MLRQLTLDEIEQYIVDDTVRPHLDVEFRTRHRREVWGLYEDQYATEDTPSDKPLAVICVAYCTSAPETEFELDIMSIPMGEAPVLSPTPCDPSMFNPNRYDTLEAAIEAAQELQGTLTVWPDGTVTNRFGETMIYDTAGYLAPCNRAREVDDDPTVAVFYTVWSYSPGAGRRLVNQLAAHIRDTNSEIWDWVTLSPITDMAEKFHLRNGAEFVARYDVNQTFSYTHQIYDKAKRWDDLRIQREREEAEQREAPALE